MQLSESVPTAIVELENRKGFVLRVLEVPVVKLGIFGIFNQTASS